MRETAEGNREAQETQTRMEIPVIDLAKAEGSGSGAPLSLPEALSGIRPNIPFLHDVVTAYAGNRRVGTASTLTRGQVRGGGRKLYKQKHTGRARAGSLRSPLRRGGGIIFGPHPRSYRTELARRLRRGALAQAVAARWGLSVRFVCEENFKNIEKTKDLVRLLTDERLGARLGCWLVVCEHNPGLARAARNYPRVRLVAADRLNAAGVLAARVLVITDKAWEILASRLGNNEN